MTDATNRTEAPTRRVDLGTADGDAGSLLVAGDAAVETAVDVQLVDDAVADRLRSADCALVNLEAPLSGGSDPIAKSGPLLSGDDAAPARLADAGFDAVTLATNHAMDFGVDGLDATVAACEDAGLDTVGAGHDHDAALSPLVRRVGGADVAVFNVCEREFGVADASSPGTAWQNHPAVDARIADAADRYDVVVVVSHGGIEEVPFPPPSRQARLREFVDLGADAVVGHHPHVAQGWEVYDGAPVVYSLGNFYFDRQNPATQWGLTAELEFAGNSLTALALHPVERVGETVVPLGVERDPVADLTFLERLSPITAEPDRLAAYWQEVAERVFLARHGDTIRAGAGGSVLSVLRSPGAALRKDGTWDPDARRAELLGLLNLARNESHREVVRTALELRTGKATDRRTDRVRDETRDLLDRTTDEELYDRPHPARELAGKAFAKVRRESRASLATLWGTLPSRS